MTLVSLRVELPDRPGVLGAVASRVGAVKGDVVGVEILERGSGVAVDELVVELADESLIDLLVSEVSEVDGIRVDSVEVVPSHGLDPWVDPIDLCARMADCDEVAALLTRLVAWLSQELHPDAVAVLSPHGVQARAGEMGELPLESVTDSRVANWDAQAAIVPLADSGFVLALKRQRPAWRRREQLIVEGLCLLAGALVKRIA